MTVAGVFGLPHLSEDAVAAYADGVLSAAAADRARRHCAECAECAEAVRAQREAALLLRTASNPSMPADLLSRLAGVPMSAPLPPPRGGLPTVLGADGIPMFVAHDQRHDSRNDQLDRRVQAGSGHQHGHRRVLLPVGILASAAAVVAAGAIGSQLGSSPRPTDPQPASVHQLSTRLTGTAQRSGAAQRSGTVQRSGTAPAGSRSSTATPSTGQFGPVRPTESLLLPASSALPTAAFGTGGR